MYRYGILAKRRLSALVLAVLAGSFGVSSVDALDTQPVRCPFCRPEPEYHAIHLGTLAGGSSYSTAVNNGGHVVGSSGSGNSFSAFYYHNAHAVGKLLSPAGMTTIGAHVPALGINDQNVVVGGDAGLFLWSPTAGLKYLPSNYASDPTKTSQFGGFASAINNNNVIVGAFGWAPTEVDPGWAVPRAWFCLKSPIFYSLKLAVVFDDAGMIIDDIGTRIAPQMPSGPFSAYSGGACPRFSKYKSSEAMAINDFGVVVGTWFENGVQSQAWAYWPDRIVHVLGTLGGDNSWASSVNGNGDVVGGAAVFGSCVRSNEYGQPGNVGSGFSGQNGCHSPSVLERYNRSGTYRIRAFMKPARGNMTDLGALATDHFSFANGINNQGDIVGVDRHSVNTSTVFTASWHDEDVAVLFRKGAVIDLNTIVDPKDIPGGWSIVDARAISNTGYIAATACDSRNPRNRTRQCEALRLDPIHRCPRGEPNWPSCSNE